MKDAIILDSKHKQDIYINPKRQEILRILDIEGVPLNSKEISLRAKVSPSSIKHHMDKLIELGVVEISHSKMVNGIRATYYRTAGKTVSVGINNRAFLQGKIQSVLDSLSEKVSDSAAAEESAQMQIGDIMTGVVHLTKEESAELLAVIRDFLRSRERGGDNTEGWEYALIAYNTKYEKK